MAAAAFGLILKIYFADLPPIVRILPSIVKRFFTWLLLAIFTGEERLRCLLLLKQTNLICFNLKIFNNEKTIIIHTIHF